MANMEKVYALQARIRKIATTKKLKEVFIDYSGKPDKSGVIGTVRYRGNAMEFRRIDANTTKCTAHKIMGFESLELNPADTVLLEFLFFGGGQITPAQFKKCCEDKLQPCYRDFSVASPAFDIVVGFWHDQLIREPLRSWENAQAAVAQKSATATTTQQIVAANTAKTI